MRELQRASSPAPNSTDLRRVGLHPDFWYPLARAGEVKKGKTLPASFAGEPIVLYRAESGEVFALENRCPHRQMPLEYGVVEGEQLRCCYHAWCFHGSGKLANIPYLPKGAKPPRGVRAYPCREAYGHVFVFPGDPEKAQEAPFPDVPVWSLPTHKTMYFSREVKCHYSFMHENLMDMNHQFLHRGILGSIQPTLLGYERGENWVEARYKFQHAGGRKHRGAGILSAESKKRDGASGDVITIRTQYPYQTLQLVHPEGGEPAFSLWTAYVPVDAEQRRNHSFGMLMIKKPAIPGLIHLIWPFMRRFTEKVFAEDRMAVEAEQAAWDAQGGDWNQEIFPLILDLREVLASNGVPISSNSTLNP